MTVNDAIDNAVRLLQNAEMETDLAKMQCLEHLADSWIALVPHLAERERV